MRFHSLKFGSTEPKFHHVTTGGEAEILELMATGCRVMAEQVCVTTQSG